MSRKGKEKKDDGDLERELKMMLQLDIEVLEKQIHLEQERDTLALRELELITKQIKEEEHKIETTKNEEIRKLNFENEKLKDTDYHYNAQVRTYESLIKEQEEEIKRLNKDIERNAELYARELEDKDAAINEQRRLLEDMSIRFQHILQRTANKLQERVNMAGV